VGLMALALSVEATLRRMARGAGLLDLGLGEALNALSGSGRLIRLGFSQIADYSRERLGVPASTALAWMQLARELRDRPVLRRAVRNGMVSPRKALVVCRVAVGTDEPAWTAAASKLTEKELRQRVKESGGSAPEEWRVEVIELRMAPAQQDRLDRGIALAREVLGPDRPRWQCIEAMAMEFQGSHGSRMVDLGPTARGKADELGPDWIEHWRERSGDVLRQLDALHDASSLIDGPGVEVCDTFALDARLRRLVRARHGFDGPLGRQARLVRDMRAWRFLGFQTWEEYCRERLGLSARTLQQRIWLEEKMERLPEIREALESGRLTYSKALHVARCASVFDVEQRIEKASRTTDQQTARESEAAEDAQNRRAGRRRVWGEKDGMETVRLAIACARAVAASQGEIIDDAEALARLADHFLEVWSEHAVRRRLKIGADRLKVLERTKGICAVPGCTRPAEHEHHLVLRSQGGGEESWNRIGLCDYHHLAGIHGGLITLTGRAGERLEWRFKRSESGAHEIWVTTGDDDVGRACPTKPWRSRVCCPREPYRVEGGVGAA